MERTVPELPEVEFCGRSLARWTAGRRVVGVEVLDPRSIRRRREDRPTLAHPEGEARLRDVVLSAPPGPLTRHGKRLLWAFGGRALLLHLGMTGKWTRRPGPHTKLRLLLDEGPPIELHDPRLLGGVVPTDLVEGPRLLAEGLGPDALGAPLPPLRGRRPVKVALLDQSVVAGLGNLHAAEALWRARVHPATPCDELSVAAHRRLHQGVQAQLAFALTLLEADDEIVYVEDPGGPNPFPLYQRGGDPCPVCSAPITSMVQAGRTTWWCPGCQPAPRRSRRAPGATAA